MEDGVDPTTSLLNISKLYMIALTDPENQNLSSNHTDQYANYLISVNTPVSKINFQVNLRNIDPDKTDTRTQLDITYETCEKVRDYIESRELTNGNKGGINFTAFRNAPTNYPRDTQSFHKVSQINPVYFYPNSKIVVPQPLNPENISSLSCRNDINSNKNMYYQ